MSSKIITRREFLQKVSLSPILLSLSLNPGCLLQPPVTVSLVKDTDDSHAIRRALELIGGLDFLHVGDSVLLKLALNSANPFPATTSPVLLSELITLLKDHGAGDIVVADRSKYGSDTMHCMQETGIYQAAVDRVAQLGYVDNFMGYGTQRIRFVGHGIGLELDEYPFLAEGQQMKLQAGMTVALEPKLVFPGRGVVGVENTHVVTENGLEQLTRFEEEVIVV